MIKQKKKIIDNLLKEGLKKFNQNEFQESEKIFKKIIEMDNTNIRANHAMGVLYGSTGEVDLAIKFFNKALTFDKNFTPSLINLGLAYYKKEKINDSFKIFRELENKDPNNWLIQLNLGNCYFKLSDLENAKYHYIKSIELNDKNFEPFLNLGIIDKKNQKYLDAQKYLLTAESLSQNNKLVIQHIGDLFYKIDDYEKSINYSKKYLELDPNNSDIYCRLVCLYFLIEDFVEANKLMDKVISLTPDLKKQEKYFQAVCSVIIRVNNYDTDKDYSLCVEYADQAEKINPSNYAILSYRAIAKYFTNDPVGAVNDAEKAKFIEPRAEITLGNLANFYRYTGDFEKSEKNLREYFDAFPNKTRHHFLFSTVCLAQKKFREGWLFYEGRWSKDYGAPKDKKKPDFMKPLWRPELGYNSILVWAEQGLGDQILHGSILEDFSKRFKKTYLAIDPRLVEIFQAAYPQISVFSLFDEIKQDFFDYQIPLTSLGAYCRKSIEDFLPLKTPFQNLSHSYTKNNDQKLKCAISWKSVNGMHSKLKTSSLNALSKIFSLEQIDFYNIQYSDETEEVQKAKENFGLELKNPPNLDVKNDLMGLVNFIQSCDFVLSTSNTNVHLAGAIGKKAYVLLPTAAGRFWYWETTYEGKNIWYPSLEIFKQNKNYDWSDPVERVYEKIKADYGL